MQPPDWLWPLLVCPRCNGPLSGREALREAPTSVDELGCGRCLLAYPIREGVPWLLVEEARPSSTD
jgi:uncharacterized protein